MLLSAELVKALILLCPEDIRWWLRLQQLHCSPTWTRLRDGRRSDGDRSCIGWPICLASWADKLAPREIELFDNVLVRLADRSDIPSLVKLSRELPDTKRSLPKTVRRLVLHENAAVSTPILQFRSLPPDLLVEAAQTQGLEHLKAIAGRHSIEPSYRDASGSAR